MAPVLEIGQVAFTRGGQSVIGEVNGVAKPLADQFGGYAPKARTSRRATSVYGGVGVRGMVIPVLLDGWIGQRAVTPRKRLLEAMASPSGKHELTPPAAIEVTGTVPYPGRWWVIQSLEPGDDILLRADDGVCLRQDYIVTVVELPVDGVILTNGKRYTVRKGDTLTSIAARQLGNAKRWKQIKSITGKTFRDPKAIKPGQIVKLP